MEHNMRPQPTYSVRRFISLQRIATYHVQQVATGAIVHIPCPMSLPDKMSPAKIHLCRFLRVDQAPFLV